jgi:hypothetical protein
MPSDKVFFILYAIEHENYIDAIFSYFEAKRYPKCN